MVSSFFKELVKIAQDNVPVDPRQAEMESIQQNSAEPKDINREVLKQKAKHLAAIGGGALAGGALGTATNIGLDKLLQRHGKSMPKWALPVMAGVIAPTMGYGSHLAYSKMREQDRKLLEEARQRGEQGE